MEMGPLPSMDRNAQLQQLSIRALNALLARDELLLFREERVDDYGVDAAFEARFHGSPTNFRAPVQLKATESISPNADGSYSKSVATANLNYLLNGTSGIYVLYVATDDRFYFSWAAAELSRLNRENPNWKEQKTIALRFENQLTTESIAAINERIIQEGKSFRQVRDSLAKASVGEVVHFAVEADGSKVRDPEEVIETLANGGFAAVTNGFAIQVLEMVDSLPPAGRRHPKVALTASYASYSLGRFADAATQVGRLLGSDSLTDESDIDAAEQIRASCQFQLGIVDFDTAMERRRDRLKASGGAASIFDQIDVKRFEALRVDTTEGREAMIELRRLVGSVKEKYGSSDARAVQVRLHLLYAEGFAAHSVYSNEISRLAFRGKIEISWKRGGTIDAEKISKAFGEWLAEMASCLDDATKTNNAMLVGEVFRVQAMVFCHLIQSKRFFFERMQIGKLPESDSADQILEHVAMAKKWFGDADYQEGVLSAEIVAAESLLTVGRIAEATALAEQVRRRADLLMYPLIVQRADDVLQQRAVWTMQFNSSRDTDLNGPFDDESVERFAETIINSMGIPSVRMPIVRQAVRDMSLAGAYRLFWCRHVQILEDLRHTHSPVTAYAAPLNHVCKCALFGVRSSEPGGTAADSIHELMWQYCLPCRERSPKRAATLATP